MSELTESAMDKILDGEAYAEALTIRSEVFSNIAYQIIERNICAYVNLNCGLQKIFGTADDMRQFAIELLEVANVWEDIRT